MKKLGYIFIGLLILFLLSIVSAKALFAWLDARHEAFLNEKPYVYNENVSISLSDSMEPTIMTGSKMLRVGNDYTIGDIIGFRCVNTQRCFHDTTHWIVHRLVSIKPDGCMVIIGDNPKYDWSIEPCYYPSDIEIDGKYTPLKN